MPSFKNTISFFTLFNVIGHILSLVELPAVEDNNIRITERIIRDTVNNLFTAFRIRNVRQKPKLKQFSTIHNFFVSITLKDCDNLKEIARLTRVNNVDNNTQHFITQINDLLNEGDKNNEETDDVYVTAYIEAFVTRLRYLKETYGNLYNRSSENLSVNADVLKLLNQDLNILGNLTNLGKTNNSDDNVLDQEEVWQPSGRRIYQGHRTRIRFFPFMATIQIFEKFQCGGSIIRKDLVITAASCLQLAWNNRFFRENPAFLSVQIGCDYYSSGGENIPVLEIHFHPEYNPKYLRNNLAVLRLSSHIIFDKKRPQVKRIEIDKRESPLPVNTNGIVILGFGAKTASNILFNPWHNRLSYAELDYYPLKECQEIYSREYVSEKNFCAGFLTKGGGACNYDVGGPGISAGRLVGVISFGPPICGTVDAPTVFTKVGFYKRWLENIMKQEVPDIIKLSTKMRAKTTFAPHFSDITRKTFWIKPVDFKSTSLIPHDEPPFDYKKDNIRIVQDDLYKEFMSTLFEEQETEDYFNPVTQSIAESNKKIALENEKKPMKSVPTTNAPSDYEPFEDSESGIISKEEPEFKSKHATTVQYTDNNKVSVENLNDNNEAKLEEDIANLLDDLDLYKLLQSGELANTDDEQSDKVAKGRKHSKLYYDFDSTKEDTKHDETKSKTDSELNEMRANIDGHSTETEGSLDYDFREIISEADDYETQEKVENELNEVLANQYNELLKTGVEDGIDNDEIMTKEDINLIENVVTLKRHNKKGRKENNSLDEIITEMDNESVKKIGRKDKKPSKSKRHKNKHRKTAHKLYKITTDEDNESVEKISRKDRKSLKLKRQKNKGKKIDKKLDDSMTDEENQSVKLSSRNDKKSPKIKRGNKKVRKTNDQTTLYSSDNDEDVDSGDDVSTSVNESEDEEGLSIEID